MITELDSQATEELLVRRIAEGRDRIRKELAKVIRGQDDVIELLLIALLSGGPGAQTILPGNSHRSIVPRNSPLAFQRCRTTTYCQSSLIRLAGQNTSSLGPRVTPDSQYPPVKLLTNAPETVRS